MRRRRCRRSAGRRSRPTTSTASPPSPRSRRSWRRGAPTSSGSPSSGRPSAIDAGPAVQALAQEAIFNVTFATDLSQFVREGEAAWRALLDDLLAHGLKTPEFLIVDAAAGLEKALAALWPEVPTQRCTVHKHRNLLAHAPDQLHEEVSADYTDMIYAATPKEMEERRKAFCASGG